MADYSVIVVGPPTASDAGEPRAELHNAEVQRISWELNQPGICTFRLPVTDSKANSVKLMETEILVTRNDRKVFRGVPVRAEADEQFVTFQCPGLLWYLSRRFVGDANRPNLLSNASFEGDPVGNGTPSSWGQGTDALETVSTVNSKSAQDGDKFITLQESRTVSTWTQSDGSGAATVEDITARLVARNAVVASGVGQTIDGQTVASGDRVLLTNQANGKNNGVFVAGAGAWVRASNFDSDAEVRGKRIKITAGNQWADTGWKNTNSSAITVDTTSLSFSQYAYTKITPRDSRLTQAITPTPGVRYTAKGWFRIDSWSGPGLRERGLWLSVYRADNNRVLASAVYKIDKDTRRNQWVRAEASVKVPSDANATQVRLRVSLCGIQGTIAWDATRLVKRDYLFTGESEKVHVAKQLVLHAQDTAYNKTDLNIAVSGTNNGDLTNRRYPHDEHTNILEALHGLTEGSEGIDFYVDEDTRTFTVLSKRGSDKPQYALELGRNIGGWSFLQDGEQVANAVVVMAPGDGPDREEAYARTLGGFDGMAYEAVLPMRSHYKELARKANHAVSRRNRLVEHMTVTTIPGADNLVDNLQVGDVVPVRIHRGYVDFDEDRRVWGIDLEPTTDVLTLRLNKD